MNELLLGCSIQMPNEESTQYAMTDLQAHPKPALPPQQGATLCARRLLVCPAPSTADLEGQFDVAELQQGDISCAYRLSQDGLRTMLPYITRQVIHPTAAEMLRILKDRYISVPKDEVPPSPPPCLATLTFHLIPFSPRWRSKRCSYGLVLCEE